MTSSHSNQPDPGQAHDTGRPPVDDANPSAPPPPPPGQAVAAAPEPKRGGRVARVVAYVLLLLLLVSIAVNLYFGTALFALMGGPRESVYQQGDASQRIVIVPVEGMIDGSQVDFVRRSLDQLDGENKPAAIILRVESGGGGVTASDQIWHQIKSFKQKTELPVVASFGSAAASGGYYIAMPSDHIVAERTCVTGSIGVIAPAFTFEKMMDKLGITPEVIEAPSSPKKGLGNNVFRSWNEADRQVWRNRLAHAHQQFIDVVIQGRAKTNKALSEDRVRELAQGQTFNAIQAKENHLVDEVGYLDDAIAEAKSLAGIDQDVTPQVTEITPPESLISSLLFGRARQKSLPRFDSETIRSTLHELTQRRAMYRAPVGP
jgi:protease-4